jgi:uncharacterized membrane protein (DUF485 family)
MAPSRVCRCGIGGSHDWPRDVRDVGPKNAQQWQTTCRTVLCNVPHRVVTSGPPKPSQITRPDRVAWEAIWAKGRTPMSMSAHDRIQSNPKFRELVESRGRLAAILSVIMLVIYFGFILLVAYAPGFLGTPIGSRVMTIGIPLGVVVIISAFVLTGIYVSKANAQFDRLNAELLKEVR